MKTIRIGNGAGFWGDNLDAPRVLAEAGSLDYLTLEYLAELTMSILTHQKSRNPGAGDVTDFPPLVEKLVPIFQQSPKFRIVTNAGGMNPLACAKNVAAALNEAGLGKIKIAAVSGDDVFADLDEHLQAGVEFRNMETGEPLGKMKEKVTSANAYLGAEGIVQALSAGAKIVVTGRVADASLTVGPCLHEFGWGSEDWHKLATATVAGHLIECGAQMTGGMFSDWTPEISLADVGYPIAEIGEDSSVVLTKAEGSGGTVTTATVAEQLVYEIGDPAHYLTPDVDADFSQVRLTQVGENRVSMTEAQGNPAPVEYKVSMSYADGYMYSGTLVIAGHDAEVKARTCSEIVFARLKRARIELDRTNVECLGAGDSLPGVWPRTENLYEVVLRISAHHSEKEPLERLSRELAPLVTSGLPGVTGYAGARSKPHRVLAYWPTTIPRERAVPNVTVQTAGEWLT